MVKIITLRPFRGDEGFVAPKTTLDVSDKRADQLVKKKLATYLVGAKMAPAPAKNKMEPAAGATKGGAAAATAGESPTTAPRTGSQTGEVKPASSSRRARRRKA